MACKTCRRDDMPDECGPVGDEKCPCCGMQIIARAENAQASVHYEEPEPDNSDPTT